MSMRVQPALLVIALCIASPLACAGFSFAPTFLRGSTPASGAVCKSPSRGRAQICSLRSQSDELGWGWKGRPESSVAKVREEKNVRVSVSGEISIKGANIMYDYLPGEGPTVMYLPALNRTRHGDKATAIKTWCRRMKRSYLVADYYGVGQSSGEYKDATISRWADDTAYMIEWLGKKMGQEQVVLVGAGVGGWVMLHAAQKMPSSVVGLVGVAADPDFTEDIVLPKLSDEVKATIEKEGVADFEWGGKPYTLTKNMISDGKKMMVLDKGAGSIQITCPVRLLQGLGDEEIPPSRALKLSEAIQGQDVVITYVKYGSHEMDDNEEDFKRIYKSIEDIDRQLSKKIWMASMNRPV